MHTIEMDEMKRIQLEILDEIHEFCTSRSIKYSLAFGTLLGAVRHKGYIPWDDDIDLMMPRWDYERFIREYSSERNELLDLRKKDACVETFCKVSRKGTVMTDIDLGRSLWGVNVDVFPIDGCPEDVGPFFREVERQREELARICPFYKVVTVGKVKWFVKYLAKRLLYRDFHSFLARKHKVAAFLSTFDAQESGWAWCDEVKPGKQFRSSIFNSYTELPFEGKPYHAMAGWEEYLKAEFGDYLTLPPVEERVSSHQYDVFWVD